MKAIIFAFGLVVGLVAVQFIEPISNQVNVFVNSGRATGISNCVKLGESPVISANAIRSACADKFSVSIYTVNAATGRASAESTFDRVMFSGTLENLTPNQILTNAQFVYEQFDEEGARKEFFATANVWIEPQTSESFEVQFRDFQASEFLNLAGCDVDASERKSCWSWGILGLRGVSLN